jgi:hypothetical protein
MQASWNMHVARRHDWFKDGHFLFLNELKKKSRNVSGLPNHLHFRKPPFSFFNSKNMKKLRGARALAFSATAKHQSRGPFMAFQQTKETIGDAFTECSITFIFFTLDGDM